MKREWYGGGGTWVTHGYGTLSPPSRAFQRLWAVVGRPEILQLALEAAHAFRGASFWAVKYFVLNYHDMDI